MFSALSTTSSDVAVGKSYWTTLGAMATGLAPPG
jgi:hypothetical protein